MNNPGYLGSSLRQILLKLEATTTWEKKKKKKNSSSFRV